MCLCPPPLTPAARFSGHECGRDGEEDEEMTRVEEGTEHEDARVTHACVRYIGVHSGWLGEGGEGEEGIVGKPASWVGGGGAGSS